MHHVLLVFTLCLIACGGSAEEAPAAAPVPQEPAPAVAAAGAPATNTAALAKADLKDGAEDKVISQCGMCSLHMEGNAAHAVQAGDYTLHMCSKECKAAWEKDPAASMAILEKAVQ